MGHDQADRLEIEGKIDRLEGFPGRGKITAKVIRAAFRAAPRHAEADREATRRVRPPDPLLLLGAASPVSDALPEPVADDVLRSLLMDDRDAVDPRNDCRINLPPVRLVS
jgi:hypothetical protein